MTPLPSRSKDDPWKLKTPPGTSEYTMHTDEKGGVKILVCTAGSTVLHYDLRCIDDLKVMLKRAGGWVELGGADEQKPAKEGTVEAWGRSEANPPEFNAASSATSMARPAAASTARTSSDGLMFAYP